MGINTEDEPGLDENDDMDSLRQRVAELEAVESERVYRDQAKVETRRKRDQWIVFLLSVSPLLLEIFLFVINRAYMTTLFLVPNLPYGLLIQAVIFILALLSFITLRSSLSVLRSGRVISGWVMGGLVFVLLILPAWQLVILAPAALMIVSSSL